MPAWAQGRSGLGQGGYTAAQFERAIGEPVSIALRAPIPLDVELKVRATGSGWQLVDGDTVVMAATPERPTFGVTEAVDSIAARSASANFSGHDEHAAPECLSCGVGEKSMQVWAGPLHDGTNRYATEWLPPPWAGDADGIVHEWFVWMALDCTSGFFVAGGAAEREAVTVQFAAEVIEPIRVGACYVVVGFDGNWVGGWDGRKRGAGSCVFDDAGRLIAQADSFWVQVGRPPRES